MGRKENPPGYGYAIREGWGKEAKGRVEGATPKMVPGSTLERSAGSICIEMRVTEESSACCGVNLAWGCGAGRCDSVFALEFSGRMAGFAFCFWRFGPGGRVFHGR